MACRSARPRSASHPPICRSSCRGCVRFWRAGTAEALRGQPCRAGRHDEARRSRMDGPARPIRHQACCARTARWSSMRARPSSPGLAARLGGTRALRHQLPPCRGRCTVARCSRACRRVRPGFTLVPGWKTVDDPKLIGARRCGRYAGTRGAALRQGCEVDRVESGAGRRAIIARRAQSRRGKHQTRRRRPARGRISSAATRRPHPLETERGYNYDFLPWVAFDVKRQLIFSGHGFVITPL